MKTVNLKIRQGDVFNFAVLYGERPLKYVVITDAQQSAPLRLTVPSHGLPEGWPVAITNIKGMVEANCTANDVRESDYYPATVIDADTIEINSINAKGFRPYISGGVIQFFSPVDLTGASARMTIRDKVGGSVLASSDSADAPLDVINVLCDVAKSAITVRILTSDTAGFDWVKGVYDLEVIDDLGQATTVCTGTITVDKQVTT